MARSTKTAWLIGVYSNHIEYRIKKLGYTLKRYYPDLNFKKETNDLPLLIAFTEDPVSDPANIEKLRRVYPKALMIHLPIHLPSDHPSYHQPSKKKSEHSIVRLITNIEEMETSQES
jgi:hypothetical protein